MSSAQEDRADGWQRQAGQHLATIAALARQNREKDARIAAQAARIAELEAHIATISTTSNVPKETP